MGEDVKGAAAVWKERMQAYKALISFVSRSITDLNNNIVGRVKDAELKKAKAEKEANKIKEREQKAVQDFT